MIFLVYCIASLFYYVCVVSCPYVIYYPTVMAQYSLFVLKVPLNPKQTNKQTNDHAPQESIGGCSSPSPRGGQPLMSVTCGQCDARPTVTFPAARHHRPLAGTKLYCLVTETRVLTTCPGLHSTAGAGVWSCNLLIANPAPYRYATEPHMQWATFVICGPFWSTLLSSLLSLWTTFKRRENIYHCHLAWCC